MASATQGLTDLQNAIDAQTVQSQAVVAQFTLLNQELAALQNQTQEVTDAQLEAFAQKLQSAQAAVAAALAPSTVPTPPATAATPAVPTAGTNAS